MKVVEELKEDADYGSASSPPEVSVLQSHEESKDFVKCKNIPETSPSHLCAPIPFAPPERRYSNRGIELSLK
jgi:hypothetical protein